MGFLDTLGKYSSRLLLAGKPERLKTGAWHIHRSLSTLDIISIDSDLIVSCKKLTEFNEKYGTDKGYAEAIEQYQNARAKSITHNETVRRIFSEIDQFAYNLFISDPIAHNEAKLQSFERIALEVSSYSNHGEKAKLFLEQYYDLKNNFQQLVIEFKNLKKAQSLLKSLSKHDKSTYIDNNEEKDILLSFEKLLSRVGKTKYYEWPSIDEFKNAINEHNISYIEHAIKDPIFDNIDGTSLSEEQRRAIVCEDNVNLVVAAAGSGKTKTVCGRIKYLLEKLQVSPEEILVLSYSKNTVKDLQDKVSLISHDISVKTFHSLGLSILNDTREGGGKYEIHDQFKAVISEYFDVELNKDRAAFLEVLHYFAYYSTSLDQITEKFKDIGDLYSSFKENTTQRKFKTLKDSLIDISGKRDNLETLDGEYVKSYEELVIANYLCLNGINYRYEEPYKHNTKTSEKRQYKPDFYLPDYDLYWEHYGITSDFRCPQFEQAGEEAYLESIKWKRELHAKYQTKCIETYSFLFNERKIFDAIDYLLQKHGVKKKPLSPDELYEKKETIIEGRSFKHFKNLILSFLNLYKARYTDDRMFEEFKNASFPNEYEKHRAIAFLSICKRIYNYYRNHLKYYMEETPEGTQRIDFDDMILKSTSRISASNQFKYKYIIVDEFQDISYSRMKLLQALIEHGKSKLLAVGDDWQSIYRFAGSDIDIFVNFEKYFGKGTINKLTETYRNSNNLLQIVAPFVMSNPRQIRKNIKSAKTCEHPIQIRYYDNDKDKPKALEWVLKEIYKVKKDASVFLLGRNNYDIDAYLSSKCKFKSRRNSNSNDDPNAIIYTGLESLNISFKTAHASKGLQADYVVIINAEDALTGFPNKMEDDILLSLVLASQDPVAFAEERRLFYVALTRTQNSCYILANNKKISKFVQEILEKCHVTNPIQQQIAEKCPRCKSGLLILRSGRSSKFYGCSNHPYCNYTNSALENVERGIRCPKCGEFLKPIFSYTQLGCPNYPQCNGIRIPYPKNQNSSSNT